MNYEQMLFWATAKIAMGEISSHKYSEVPIANPTFIAYFRSRLVLKFYCIVCKQRLNVI